MRRWLAGHFRAGALLVVTTSPLTHVCAATLDAPEILTNAAAQQRLTARSSSRAKLDCQITEGGGSVEFEADVARSLLLDKRLFKIVTLISERSRMGKPSSQTVRREYILAADGRHVIHVPDTLVVLGGLNSTQDPWTNTIAGSSTLGGFLDGYVPLGENGAALSAELALTGRVQGQPRVDQVLGAECAVITSESEHWRLELWIAPAQHFAVLRTVLHGTTPGAYDVYDVTIDDVKLKQDPLSNTSYVAEARLVATVVHANPDVMPSRIGVVASRRELELNPVFATDLFTFSEIKDGTPVQQEGKSTSGIRYVWQAGQPVASVDNLTVDGIGAKVQAVKSRPLNSSHAVGSSLSTWRVIGGVALVTVGFGIGMGAFLKSRRARQ